MFNLKKTMNIKYLLIFILLILLIYYLFNKFNIIEKNEDNKDLHIDKYVTNKSKQASFNNIEKLKKL